MRNNLGQHWKVENNPGEKERLAFVRYTKEGSA